MSLAELPALHCYWVWGWLGLRQGGKWRPVTGTKEFQAQGWKWILISIATPCSHPPLPSSGSPSLHWPLLGNPVPLVTLWCCSGSLNLSWKTLALLSNNTGESDSPSLCYSADILILLPCLSLLFIFTCIKSSPFLIPLFVSHHLPTVAGWAALCSSDTTTILTIAVTPHSFSHIIRPEARIAFMWLFRFTTIWSGRWHTNSWTHVKYSVWPECLVLGITEMFERMFFAAPCLFFLKAVALCHVLL